MFVLIQACKLFSARTRTFNSNFKERGFSQSVLWNMDWNHWEGVWSFIALLIKIYLLLSNLIVIVIPMWGAINKGSNFHTEYKVLFIEYQIHSQIFFNYESTIFPRKWVCLFILIESFFAKKIRRFVVTQFVKLSDEFDITMQNCQWMVTSQSWNEAIAPEKFQLLSPSHS